MNNVSVTWSIPVVTVYILCVRSLLVCEHVYTVHYNVHYVKCYLWISQKLC